MRIVVIGTGGIGSSVAEGIRQSGITGERITITRKSSPFSEKEEGMFNCTYDNRQAVSASNVVIIAVQPKQMDDLLKEIKEVLTSEHLLISVVSGISIGRIEELLGKKIPIARAMPNTAISVRESMTCLELNEAAKEYQSIVEEIFNAVGITLIIPEDMFPQATGLCGSGTAFGLKYIRGYMQACIQNGFNEKDALMIASQVVKGAAMIVQNGDNHPEVEIDKVTTPGGCTIDGIVEMDHAGFISALLRGIKVCIDRARQLYEKK